MSQTRSTAIDFLRGLAVVLMILIHASAYYLNNKISFFVWDYSHFAVPLFVFCSAYVYFKKDKKDFLSLQYFFKRIKRLVFPYYIFLLFYFLILIFIAPSKLNFPFILSQIAFGSGRDTGWLVILFLYLIIIFPFIKLVAKRKILFNFFILILILHTYGSIFNVIHIPFRTIMWFPWILFVIFTYLLTQNEEKNIGKYYLVLIPLIFFILAKTSLVQAEKSLVLTDNKYPPNLYYLSYGAFFSSFLYFGYRFLEDKGFIANRMQTIFYFFSRYSYSLFFIHFLYIYLTVGLAYHKNLNMWSFFAIILGLTIITQLLINYCNGIIIKKGSC